MNCIDIILLLAGFTIIAAFIERSKDNEPGFQLYCLAGLLLFITSFLV